MRFLSCLPDVKSSISPLTAEEIECFYLSIVFEHKKFLLSVFLSMVVPLGDEFLMKGSLVMEMQGPHECTFP